MNRLELALAWKEIRQTFVLFIAFAVLILIYFSFASYYQHHPNASYHMPDEDFSKIVLAFALFLSAGFLYLNTAGPRILEGGENLDRFLYSKPVSRWTVVKVYYFTSLFSWLVWALVFLLFVLLFFRNETSAIIRYSFNSSIFGYLLVILAAHFATFLVSLLSPTLTVTSCTFIGTILSLFLFAELMSSNPERIWTFMAAVLPWLTLGILFVMLSGILLYVYQRKQIE
jgi:predicted membrane protein